MTTLRSLPVALTLLGFASAGLMGCGNDGPELAAVTGVVTLDGKPVPRALVTFSPEGANGTTSCGFTNAEGRYELAYNRDNMGAVVSKHQVTIRTEKPSADELAAAKSEGAPLPEFVKVPPKYGLPGTISVDVNPGGNDIALELSDRQRL